MAIQFPSLLFTPGRDCVGPTAVVLHEYKSGMEMLDKEMDRCLRPRPLCSPGCHTSFHYGIGACHLHQYINTDDTAWGFYFIPTPTCPEPPCPIEQICDGLGSDQYNPDFDGNPATPLVAAGDCLEANCSVIHVAVITGTATVSDGIYCIGAPTFSERAYNCLVQSLCEIFETAGLTPVSGTNLLTHIGELVNLDVDQLAIDILACINAPIPPLPPCDCVPIETANTVVDTATLDLGASGLFGRVITGSVKISATVGNQIVANLDGLFVPADTEVPLTVVDTNSINLTASGTDNHTLQADLIISPDVGNQASILANGLFVSETPITPVDTNTIDLTISGVNSHTVQADVIISAGEGNVLEALPGGLYVPEFQLCASITSLPVTGPLVAGTNVFADDCTYYTVPDFQAALTSVACDIDLPRLPVVLGGDGTTIGAPIWGIPARMPLNTLLFTQALDTVGPEGADVFIYNGAGAHAVDLEAPAAECTANDLWIKNSSAFALTITPTAGLIDGVASITLLGTSAGAFPFGTNGGEAVHLIWNGSNWINV
jgi:hypothetical protein